MDLGHVPYGTHSLPVLTIIDKNNSNNNNNKNNNNNNNNKKSLFHIDLSGPLSKSGDWFHSLDVVSETTWKAREFVQWTGAHKVVCNRERS